MKIKSAVAIIGPNGVGKTVVAFELARHFGNGEIINLDKLYLFKHFPISSGLSDTLKEKNVKKHFYELLEPDENIIAPQKYAKMIMNECSKIINNCGVPIIEGGSTTYFPDFYKLNKREKFCKIIGLKFPSGFDIRNKITERVEIALEDGLLQEVTENLKKYRETLIMKDGHFVVPPVRYLDKEINFNEAQQQIVERCLRYADQQMELFEKYSNIIWINHESKLLSQTVEKIAILIEG